MLGLTRRNKERGQQMKTVVTLPVRTCCVCRIKVEKKNLSRFVLEDGKPVEDRQHRKNGRGAYCCRNEGCGVAFLRQPKRWKRAFRLGE
jgi:predicted RNA-binding protein YlxR (DUF448 family)